MFLKLLILGLVFGAVWHFWRKQKMTKRKNKRQGGQGQQDQRQQDQRQQDQRQQDRFTGQGYPSEKPPFEEFTDEKHTSTQKQEVMDLIMCPHCEAYHPRHESCLCQKEK